MSGDNIGINVSKEADIKVVTDSIATVLGLSYNLDQETVRTALDVLAKAAGATTNIHDCNINMNKEED